ncbi:hypothetical protein G3480_19625 [Thiorhodococcus mannitoliphagus]|uniref:F5/8 type C domain-containing protein n=1 Tax=Thiorhodococcus mannitoliphagus TaxID=329406 RepID=A0A6P1DYD4_9GAMM|nr:hypothetical protein [Thiorhodococcus mannitoliphagus]NEX22490.1 hypothetical protein [Thiorhodococcus mannitoliphagus]
MQSLNLDDFSDLASWSTVASGQAEAHLVPDSGPEGPAMRLDFDFDEGGGFVVARKLVQLSMPDSFAFVMSVRAQAPANAFEFKLVDASGENVWRYRDEAFDFSADWRSLRIGSRQIDFGWGPAGGGVPDEIGAIEIAVAAGPGGRGSLWLSDLRLEDRTPSQAPLVRASSRGTDGPPDGILDAQSARCWRADQLPAWVELDFQEACDYSGLILDWTSAGPRQFKILASGDDESWKCVYDAPRSFGVRTYLYLPSGCSRRLRLTLGGREGDEVPGLVAFKLQPEGFARSFDDFFERVAEDGPRGRYPRWLYREQTYWTPVDIPNGRVPALLNEEGMLEVARAGYAIEPMLTVHGELMTWADCTVQQALLQPPLPIPETTWMSAGLALSVTAFAYGEPGQGWVYLRYRIENHRSMPTQVGLYAVVRPFQVSPPWQGYKDIGGVRRIRILAYRDGCVQVNGRPALAALTQPSGFGAATFDEGSIADYVARDTLPPSQDLLDMFGFASGALRFELTVEPGEARDVWLAAPLAGREDADLQALGGADFDGEALLTAALAQWERTLGAVDLQLPECAQDAADCCKAAIGHILINRDGPALQPGPRRYTRSWIRDGAVMAAALLRFGCVREAGDFIRWYAGFQAADGNVPCCVDHEGVDWLPEHDSHGQLIFAVADYYRFSGDGSLVEELWPAVRKAVGYLEQLRTDRLTAQYQTREYRARYGLLPESVSHEGYLAHPVHSYWDDFWALRGLKDAAELAQVVGDAASAERFANFRDDFRATLYVSIDRTMDERGIDFLPGSVEWADPDPTATANALTLIDESHRLPSTAMHHSFDLFMQRFREMHGPNAVPWTNYTPYEIRIVGALVRLGRRDEAHELLRFYLDERRPPAWHQWPEIGWRDPRAPGHQGDLPHAWIGAEYALVFRDLLVYEREADQSLVVAAGIPADWVDAGEISVRGLPTIYGSIDLRFKRTQAGAFCASISGDLKLPPGGIRVAPPVPGPLVSVQINGEPSRDFNAREAQVATLPAEVSLLG